MAAKSTSEIYTANLELGWGLCRRQIDHYVARANTELDKIQQASRNAKIAKADYQLDRIISFGLQNPTVRGALAASTAALRIKVQIHGLRQPTRLELTGRDGGPVEMTGLTEQERAEQIAALLAEAARRRAEAEDEGEQE